MTSFINNEYEDIATGKLLPVKAGVEARCQELGLTDDQPASFAGVKGGADAFEAFAVANRIPGFHATKTVSHRRHLQLYLALLAPSTTDTANDETTDATPEASNSQTTGTTTDDANSATSEAADAAPAITDDDASDVGATDVTNDVTDDQTTDTTPDATDDDVTGTTPEATSSAATSVTAASLPFGGPAEPTDVDDGQLTAQDASQLYTDLDNPTAGGDHDGDNRDSGDAAKPVSQKQAPPESPTPREETPDETDVSPQTRSKNYPLKTALILQTLAQPQTVGPLTFNQALVQTDVKDHNISVHDVDLVVAKTVLRQLFSQPAINQLLPAISHSDVLSSYITATAVTMSELSPQAWADWCEAKAMARVLANSSVQKKFEAHPSVQTVIDDDQAASRLPYSVRWYLCLAQQLPKANLLSENTRLNRQLEQLQYDSWMQQSVLVTLLAQALPNADAQGLTDQLLGQNAKRLRDLLDKLRPAITAPHKTMRRTAFHHKS